MRWKRKLAVLLIGACLAAGLQAGPATAIVGGQEAHPRTHRFMAGLVDLSEQRVFCGATLISPSHLITAAHCLRGPNARAGNLAVLLGDHDYSTGADTPHAKLVPVHSITVHENFDLTSGANNIAVVTLSRAVERNEGIREAQLPWKYASGAFDTIRVRALGWGTLSFGGPVSTTLRSVVLDTMTNDECTNRGVRDLTSGSICTHTPGRDTCQYDSGGPLIHQVDYDRPLVIGVISHGRGCATDSPSVHTRVTSYLQWILRNTPGATYVVG
ncbi:serine protease [Streptomyces sp. NPDC047968]|uniref:serine protease n=1 Tax=unclassified Streptomyces TaxID=2593676 RepID=UPI00343677A2